MRLLLRLSITCSLLPVLLFQCHPNAHSDRTISPEEVYRIVYDSVDVSEYVVLDMRSRMDYVRGHLVSAHWLSPDSVLYKLPTLTNEKRPFIIYDADETRISAVASTLSKNGVTNVYVMRGGFSKWTQLGYPAAIQLVRNTNEKIDAQRKDLSIPAAHALLDNFISNVVMIDVRPYPAFAEAHIESAISIPYVPLNEFVVGVEGQNFARNRSIIIYSDRLSTDGEKAADVMLRNDFTEIYLLKCDVAEWSAVSAVTP